MSPVVDANLGLGLCFWCASDRSPRTCRRFLLPCIPDGIDDPLLLFHPQEESRAELPLAAFCPDLAGVFNWERRPTQVTATGHPAHLKQELPTVATVFRIWLPQMGDGPGAGSGVQEYDAARTSTAVPLSRHSSVQSSTSETSAPTPSDALALRRMESLIGGHDRLATGKEQKR